MSEKHPDTPSLLFKNRITGATVTIPDTPGMRARFWQSRNPSDWQEVGTISGGMPAPGQVGER